MTNQLRKTEVEYELKIRGIKTDGNANELRKRLSQCFLSNIPIDQDIINALDVSKEFEICEEKLSDLTCLVEDYEGNYKDNEFRRIHARLQHLYLRVERIPVAESGDEDQGKEEEEEKKNDLLMKIKAKIDSFKVKENVDQDMSAAERKENLDTGNDKEPKPKESEEKDEEILEPDKQEECSSKIQHEASQGKSGNNKIVNTTQASHSQTITHINSIHGNDQLPEGKAVPVYKWGLQFSNSPGQSIGAFLQRVEELRRARGVSEQQLFRSAVDLFAGSALIWYRSTVGRVKSWEELCKELKLVFRTPDYDDMLIQEIMNRTQGDQEPIDLFIAAVEGLYQRLSNPISESVRLRQILKNLNQYLQEKLCMFTISSVEELRQMGRKAELGRLRVTSSHPPPRPQTVLEPDLAYTRWESRKPSTTQQVSYVDSNNTAHRKIKCWNCSQEGHRFSACPKPRIVFCYGCGMKNVRKSNCTTCKPKNE